MSQIMISILVLLLFSSIFAIGRFSKVTYSNLQAFFNATYDSNQDGYATIQQFQEYFNLMEPDHNITKESIQNIFFFFDYDQNAKVTLDQIIKFGKIQITHNPGHKQIHLGFTQNPGEMQVMWVSNPQRYNKPVVYYAEYPTLLGKKYVQAQSTTYNVGRIGFHGLIYRAVIKDLIPLKKYYYKVGDLQTNTWSQIKHFKAPPIKDQVIQDQIKIGVFGDMGTFAPFGNTVIRQIALDNLIQPLDFVFLTGDIAYAGVNSYEKGQTEPIWDLFGQLTEKFAAYSPFMPGVGNHQSYYQFTSYFHRYRLPRSQLSPSNLWFSFDYGQVHMVHFSSQHPFTPGSPQYKFLEQDLQKASKNPYTKWIILGSHRTFYSSDACEYQPMTSRTIALQDLVKKYKVDIVQTGHLHCYQRTWPTYKGKAFTQGHDQTFYRNPQQPIYVVQGTAGALIKQKWIHPTPQWSLKRMLKYGYGRITIKGDLLKYEYIQGLNGNLLDQWYIIKSGKKQSQEIRQVQQQRQM